MATYMASLRRLIKSKNGQKYASIPSDEADISQRPSSTQQKPGQRAPKLSTASLLGFVLGLLICAWIFDAPSHAFNLAMACLGKSNGYHYFSSEHRPWGQYAPYFNVPSTFDPAIPALCNITLIQGLYRHGARDPTARKTIEYGNLITKLKENVDPMHFKGSFKFLKDYQYTLGADELTDFGRQQLVDAGTDFYDRYKTLSSHIDPFIRAAGQDRVIESAEKWAYGFHEARSGDDTAKHPDPYPYDILVISEDPHSNNTLSHDLCPAYRSGRGYYAMLEWARIFVPPILARLNAALPGADLSVAETIDLMDLCPFSTVATPDAALSPFCALFTTSEWHSYDYLETLGKWYGFGPGNPFAAAQGAGFAAELAARLTGTPVADDTSTNHTLDDDRATFPLGGAARIFVDFSHDNDILSILAALGLYAKVAPLANVSIVTPEIAGGYAASWTVPFASRLYIERMACFENGDDEEWVRVLVNGRVVVPFEEQQPRTPHRQASESNNKEYCQDPRQLGRCKLSAFLEAMAETKKGAPQWDEC